MSSDIVIKQYENNGDVSWLTWEDFPKNEDGTPKMEMLADAVCTATAAVGPVFNERFNNTSNKLYIRFDVETENGVKEYWINETLSIGPKSNLGKHLRRWYGKEFTQEQLQNFKLNQFALNRTAKLELLLAPKKNGDGYWINVDRIKPGDKDVKPLDDAFTYNWQDPAQENFDKLPKYLREMIERRDGQKENGNVANDEELSNETPAQKVDVSEIPF